MTERTLGLLVESLDGFEAARKDTGAIESLEGWAERHQPPFAEAAEVAIILGRLGEAIGLLERWKSRSLQEAIGSPFPSKGRVPRGESRRRILHLLAGDYGVYLLTSESSQEPSCEVIASLDDEGARRSWRELSGLIEAFVIACDYYRSDDSRAKSALASLRSHPLMLRISSRVASGASQQIETYVVPHSVLHSAPLHLSQRDDGTTGITRMSLLPASRLIPALSARTRERKRHGTIAAGGDSVGDLPLARAEAALIASTSEVTAIGTSLTGTWLEEICRRSDLGVLHMACHGRFNARDPDGSGLVVASSPDAASPSTLYNVPRLAALNLRGTVVVLSACSTGHQLVRPGDEVSGLIAALLKAGAISVVASLWPVPDLSTAILMIDLHKRLRQPGHPPEIGRALVEAQQAVAETSGADVLTFAAKVLAQAPAITERSAALGAIEGCFSAHLAAVNDEARREASRLRQSLKNGEDRFLDVSAFVESSQLHVQDPKYVDSRPFSDPYYWGAFVIAGLASA